MNSGLTRQLNILEYTLAALWRRRMKNISVLVVFTGVIFLIASFQMVTKSLIDTASLALRSAPDITVQRISAGRQIHIPLKYGAKLLQVFGIRDTVPRVWGYYFDEVLGVNYTVLGLEYGRMPLSEELELTLARGRMPDPLKGGEAVIGGAVQQLMEEKGGLLLSLFRPDLSQMVFEISGVFTNQTDILTNDLIVMGISDARSLFQITDGQATDLCVYVANPAEIDTVAGKIAEILPDTRVLTRSHILQTYQVVFGWRSGFASVCLLTALAAFVIFAWDKASGLSPEEKREISILKILGWQTADILAGRFWEGILVAGLAFACGCTLAYIHIAFFDASLFKPILVGWSVIRPSFSLVPSFPAAGFLIVFCFSVLPYLAATVIPAWRSASVPADNALGGM